MARFITGKKTTPPAKKSPPSPLKFKRSPVNGKIEEHNKIKKRISNRVFTLGAREGIMVAFVKHSYREEQAFIWPIKKWFLEHEDEWKDYNVNLIVPRRNNDGTDTHMPSSESNPDFPFDTFVRVLPDESQNTAKNRELWGKQLAEFFEILGADTSLFKFTCKFEFGGDLSNEPFPPVGNLILNKSVLILMETIFTTVPMQELAQDEETVTNFFGKEFSQIGKEMMLSTAQT